MTYVDAFHFKDQDNNIDKILIAENINGKRILKELPTEYVFYYSHPAGAYRSIYGDKCERYATTNAKKFKNELFKKRAAGKIFESDIKPVFRTLARDYMEAEAPTLNLAFFDIEADFHPTRGYAPTDDPFNAITAITVYLSHLKTNFTVALCPPTLTLDEARAFGDQFDNTMVFDDEKEMLLVFLDLVDACDVLTGWNSAAYDIPYLINRIALLLGKEATKKLCLWDQYPRKKEGKDRFGNAINTYELIGRVHLDYMDLYKKHNPKQQQSYALNAIGEDEVGESKVAYSGNLDQLYKDDFKLFIEYSRQDVVLLVKIDAKKKFIDLANQIAHANCVPLPTTMGTVALVDQAITNEMHAFGFVIPDRKRSDDDSDDGEERTPVVGAYVADPKAGLHQFVGCVDINSLYPSAIRALNMSPETVFGQIRPTETTALVAKRIESGIDRAEAWEGIFRTLEVDHMHSRDDSILEVDLEDGNLLRITGAELYELIFAEDSNLCITANGTIFRTDVEGMIPRLLAKWYAERKEMQKNQREYAEEKSGLVISPELAKLLE